MIDLTFEIIKNELMASDIFEMTLKTDKLPADVKAGQFANVKVPNRTDLILRRPFGIYSANFDDNTIKLGYALRGQGTKALSELPAGTKVQVLLPLGNGFPAVEEGKKVLLVGGGIGVLPLLSVAETYKNNVISSCIGFKDASLQMKVDEFKALSQEFVLASDDGSIGEKGYVAQVLAKYIDQINPDVIFACGPEIMLKGLGEFAQKYTTYVSLEQRMGCGIGACLVCSCKTKKDGEEHYARVCADGPVFKFEEVFYG